MLLACATLTVWASDIPNSSCTFGLNENLTASTQLIRALPDGQWRGELRNGEKVVLQFYASGQAEWFTFGRKGLHHHQAYRWAVLPFTAAQAALELADRNSGSTLQFTVKTNCQSIELTEKGGPLFLELFHEPNDNEETLSRMKKLLTGKWENTTYPFDLPSIDGAYLKYSFQNNGQFSRSLGSSSQALQEQGQWKLSKDGKHLILNFENGLTALAEVKYLEMDELVLKHVLSCEDKSFTTALKDFFFNRQ